MRRKAFEQQRLDLFARHGFKGESRWVSDREGRSTYLIERGDGACPTILVHGGLSQASEWAPLAEYLPGHVIIPDRPGCGLSYPIDYSGLDYRRAAVDWMLDLVDGIGDQEVDLVANSMGGFFSLAFAMAHPARVRRLVLVGAPAGLHRQLPLFIRLWGNPITGPIITKKGIRDAETLRRRVFGPLLVAQPQNLSEAFLETMVDGMALPGAGRTAYTMLRTVCTMRGWRGHLSLRDGTTSLVVPTLFLWGDSDAFAPPTAAEDIVKRMQDARIDVLSGAGHLPHVDVPGVVAERVVTFLAEASAETNRREVPAT